MATLYVMKCNKKRPHKIGMTKRSPLEIDERRRSIERSIRQEFGKDYLVKIVWQKEFKSTLMCSLIEWQIQHMLMKRGLQRKWNGFTVKSNGSSEWFYLPKGLKTFKSYLALGHKLWKSNPAPMPKQWEVLKNGLIFKKPKKPETLKH